MAGRLLPRRAGCSKLHRPWHRACCHRAAEGLWGSGQGGPFCRSTPDPWRYSRVHAETCPAAATTAGLVCPQGRLRHAHGAVGVLSGVSGNRLLVTQLHSALRSDTCESPRSCDWKHGSIRQDRQHVAWNLQCGPVLELHTSDGTTSSFRFQRALQCCRASQLVVSRAGGSG